MTSQKKISSQEKILSQVKLFFLLCIIVRLFIVYVVYKYPSNILIIPLLVISIGFIYQTLYKPRNKGTFGQNIWWEFLRPFHALTYLVASILVYNKNKYAPHVLLFDLIVGTLFHIYYRYVKDIL
jgi:hypothetical protein